MKKPNIEKSPWNKGRAVGQKAPFTPDQAAIIRAVLTQETHSGSKRAMRDLALFNVGVDTMLRGSDLLGLSVYDVTDHTGAVVDEFTIRQKKTGDANTVALSDDSRVALNDWIIVADKRNADPLFTGFTRSDATKPITTAQYRRLVKKWAGFAHLDPRKFSGHSTRRTKSTVVYQRTHNLAACQQLLGHKSIGSTATYLGVDKRQALDLAKKIKV